MSTPVGKRLGVTNCVLFHTLRVFRICDDVFYLLGGELWWAMSEKDPSWFTPARRRQFRRYMSGCRRVYPPTKCCAPGSVACSRITPRQAEELRQGTGPTALQTLKTDAGLVETCLSGDVHAACPPALASCPDV